MKRPAVLRLWVVLCTVVIFSACQKENSSGKPEKVAESELKNSGVVLDDLKILSKIPLIASADFLTNSKKYLASQQLLTARSKPIKPTSPSSDITPPSVTITSPANGSSVAGTINIAVSATDNISVSSVSLSIDGAIVGTIAVAPYNFTWNTDSEIDGTHSLTAKAIDASGNSNTYTITVTKNTTIIVLPPAPNPVPTNYQLAMPLPRNQGSEGSCVSFAVVYAARSVEQYYQTNGSNYSDAINLFSPEYVFNQVNIGGTCSASSVVPTLDLLKNLGVCTWQSMPYSDLNGCSLKPDASQDSEASKYKITSYSTIVNADQTAIKTMIANKHPIIFTCNIDQQFYDAKPGFIWKSYSNNSGSHCLTLCGYDDAIHAYKAMNSWGTNWGDGGFIWIDYDFFPTISSYYLYTIKL